MNTPSNPSELESRSEQLTSRIDFARRQANRSLKAPAVLALLREQAPELLQHAEIVGQWVWIHFAGKQPAHVTRALSEFGFHWNNVRQSWQHPCGAIRPRALFDPRKKYGSRPVV